jgi:glucose/arabinose dehydrogenase
MDNNLEKQWWVFPGFKIELMATGLDLPVNLAFVPKPTDNPDKPLLYVTELYGQIKAITNNWKIHTYAENLLNYEPDHEFPGTGESGVTGICVEPKTGDLFVTMLYEENGEPKNKLIRTRSKTGLKMDSMETLIDDIPSIKAAHQIQEVTIGFDGKLYVNLGEGMINPEVAQDDNELRGKVLRMNLDGSVPYDNPDPNSLVYAKGFRNPFGATWRKSDEFLYISDNGPAYDDRIAKVEAGGNYGWPQSMRENSLFWWHFTQAPTALAFMQNNEFSFEYKDELFVALFGGSYVKGESIKGKKIVKMKLNEDASAVKSYDEFVRYIGKGPASPCGLAFGPDGLYFTDLHGEENGLAGVSSGNIYKVSSIIKEEGEKMVPYTKENADRCLCPGCPTLNECMRNRNQHLFCARGKTECELERKGCLCGECPIESEYGLTDFYYCTEGAAKK